MWKLTFALATALALTACAGLHELSSDVSTYSQWPADRKPGTYAFERLPSQQTHPAQQQALEDAASVAFEQAAFTPAADPKEADATVQLGARIDAGDLSPYDDPFWWHGGLYRSRFGGHRFRGGGFGFGWGYGAPYGIPTYEREVALLIRDRKSGQVLFEARAVSEGSSAAIDPPQLRAMFAAAMMDFPRVGINPRRVVVPVEGR